MLALLLNPVFVEWNGRIRFEVYHAACGTCLKRFGGSNRYPAHRLYLVHSESAQPSRIAMGEMDWRTLRAGRAYLIPGGPSLSFEFERGIRLIAIHFELTIPPGFDLLGGPSEYLETDCRKREYTRIERQLHRASDFGGVLEAKAMLLAAIRPFVETGPESVSRSLWIEARYADTLAAIERAGADCRIADLAAPHGVTANTFARRFARDAGVTLKQLLQRQLLMRATRLLSETDLPIKTIAEELRFSSEFHFSKFFRTQTGQPPSRYRAGLFAGAG